MKLGIIGGSGLDDPDIFKDIQEIEVDTPYGKPSSPLKIGKINNVDVVILSRHGKTHSITPTNVNYRANIYALAKQECTHVIATTAVGSLKQEIKRGDFVFPDQLIDFTKQRKITFHDKFDAEKGPIHVSFAEPFSEFLRKKLIQSAEELNFLFHPIGTVITIEGPRFSTRAESFMFKQWGADIINMSVAPEATLAREANLEYAVVAMSTDYDCWKTDEEPVTWEIILKIMNENSEKVKKLLLNLISKISEEALYLEDKNYIKNSIRTIPNWPKDGIMFRDITTMLKDSNALKKAINIIYERYKDKNINIIAAVESRGFILGAILADKLNCAFVPIRKKGKLPFETESIEYKLEYGVDTIEIHKDAISPGNRVLLVDDLIATSGTSLASCKLIEKLGGEIVECAFVIELSDLRGRERLESKGYKVFSVIEFEGE